MSLQIRLTTGQLISLTGVLLLAFAASIGMPFNIDAIALSFKSSNTVAGMVASVELASIAAGNLTFARLAARLPARVVYLVGVILIVSLNLASTIAADTNWLLLCRAPAGFALGAVVATVMTTAGRSHKPETDLWAHQFHGWCHGDVHGFCSAAGAKPSRVAARENRLE